MSLILVTGATAGVGLATVESLVEDGHDVVLHARHPGRVEGVAVAEKVEAMVCGDLADPAQVARMAAQAEEIGRFDAVIHNAGVIDGPDVFAVNVVAPYLLTALMTPPARWIGLSSSMHRGGSRDLSGLDLDDSSGATSAYSTSKLLLTTLAMALADSIPETAVHAVDPGWVPTRMGGPGATDSLQEAHPTQTWLATADLARIQPRTGGYWHHRRTQRPHPATLDPEFRADVIRLLGEHTGHTLPAT